ncbi:MAG: M36 family metallopeptidase, partial [Gaiellales bacterium]
GSHRVNIARFEARTGNPAAIVSESAPAEAGNYVQRALDHVRTIGRALGLAATQPAEFIADPNVQTTGSGAVAVHLQQHYKGIPIFQAAETVRFAPNGALQETAGSSITVSSEIPLAPRLSGPQAVLKAAQHAAAPDADEAGKRDPFGEPLRATRVDVSGFAPQVIATFASKPDRPMVLEAGPFGDEIKASLIWFPLGEELRLSWEVLLTMPDHEGQYRTMVDAETGEILYCKQLVKSVLARGSVYLADGGGARQMTTFPRALPDYGLPIPSDLPPGFPDHWVGSDRTEGNSVLAHLGDAGATVQGTLVNGALTFAPGEPTGDDQKVLNIFYLNTFMHDYFYLLGFREADGNFQQQTFGRGGVPGDRVDARSYSGPVWGTASMGTPTDGASPVMKMGLVSSTTRHTAFDSTVVFHEFMHGVTNRLVGGPLNVHALEEPQSSGMGEGWGDYIACTINNTTVVGAWVVDDPTGIRQFRYDANFPDHFGKLGTGRYTEEHNIGEIWCATLMEVNRKIGAPLGVQLVVDALKLSPANPSFLDMRDAIVTAVDHMQAAGRLNASEHAAARSGIWTAFAKFGMGPDARSDGASLSGIVADFNVPVTSTDQTVRMDISPNAPIPDNQPAGIASTLSVAETGQMARLAVQVEIQHTYIGDLIVTLTTPGGRSAILHDRTGASADDLIRTYTSADMPALAALAGEAAQGDWTLKVADRAGADVGVLRRWGLELGLGAIAPVARGEATPALTIPDNNPAGARSALALTQSGTARAITVGVDITHTYIGDLLVELEAPSGKRGVLHNRQGSGQDNLIATYVSTVSPGLAQLVGQAVHGDWSLRVIDVAGQDIGKLNRWSLEVTL